MNKLLAPLLLCLLPGLSGLSTARAQSPDKPPKTSSCHAFIDDSAIWTLEVVKDSSGKHTPILNIITFIKGKWDFETKDIHIWNEAGREADVKRLSMDTGVPDDAYVTTYLKILGNSFIGFDLVGDFEDFSQPARVAVDLARYRFELQPVDCLQFDDLAQRINKVNFDSPNVEQDYQILKIPSLGQKIRRPDPNIKQ